MKSQVNLIAIMALFAIFFQFTNETAAQGRNSEEVEFTVLGNCGMCKDRIERAALTVRGVRRADWNQQEQKITVVYRTSRTDQESIERAIAEAGHDTENFITDDETHSNLHHCCIYERESEMLENNKLYNED